MIGLDRPSGVREDVVAQADPITAFHAELERLIEKRAAEWTVLRPTGFAANALGWAAGVRAEGDAFPDIARPLIHERDIAAVAVRALTGDGLVGVRPVLTGPARVTPVEQGRAIAAAIGRPVRVEPEPVTATVQELTGSPARSFAEWAVDRAGDSGERPRRGRCPEVVAERGDAGVGPAGARLSG